MTHQDPGLATLTERLEAVCARLEKVEKNLVTQAEFQPVRTLVYGAAGLMLTAVFTAMVAMVVLKH